MSSQLTAWQGSPGVGACLWRCTKTTLRNRLHSFTPDLQTLFRQKALYFLIFPPFVLSLQFQGCLPVKHEKVHFYPVYSQTFILKLSNPQSTICLEFTAGTSLCLIPLACSGSPFGAVSWAGAAAQHCAHLPRPFAILPAIVSIPASKTQQNFNIWYKTS